MSYSFQIVKDADGVPQLLLNGGSAEYLPDALFISGHNVKPGDHGSESVSVAVGEFIRFPIDEEVPEGHRPSTIQVLQAGGSVGRNRT